MGTAEVGALSARVQAAGVAAPSRFEPLPRRGASCVGGLDCVKDSAFGVQAGAPTTRVAFG